jgi:hypothetical protein
MRKAVMAMTNVKMTKAANKSNRARLHGPLALLSLFQPTSNKQ